ncbi:MAG: hypothetical protein IIB88_04100 [Chloroflexi bacterium]|nr:hypothetical protein [Chloroflexota bacterium]
MVLLRLSFLKALEGELLALRWNDVDLERRLVKVRGSMHRTADGLVILESKTAKSRRQLQITRGPPSRSGATGSSRRKTG